MAKKKFKNEVIISVLDILDLDPDVSFERGCYFDPEIRSLTVKECLERDLGTIINIFDQPSPTESNTTPNAIKNSAQKAQATFKKTLDLLHLIKHEMGEPTFSNKEGILVGMLREQSRPNKELSSGLMGWEWPRPVDSEIHHAIAALEKITEVLDEVMIHASKSVPRAGEQKAGKDNHDRLLNQLCRTYEHYSGKKAVAWDTGSSSPNAGKIYGSIIPFLQTLLPYTHYGYSITDVALQQKIERMRK